MAASADPAPLAAAVQEGATSTRTDFFWQHTGEPWHVFGFLLLAVGLAWWSWRRYGPAPSGAAGWLARTCRALVMVLLVALIAGPAWRTTATTVLPGRVLVAVDRSASMARADLPDGRPRIAAASDLQRELALAATDRQLALDWQGIGGVPGPLAVDDLAAMPLTTPGDSSPLADEILRLVGGTRPDLLILVADCRVTEGAAFADAAEHLRSRDLQVAVLLTGGEAIEPRLWIDDLVLNKDIALNEIETITVRWSLNGRDDAPITVRLLVEGQPPQEQQVVPPPAGADAAGIRSLEQRLEAVFPREGASRVRVEVQQGELVDAREVGVQVAERKLQVLILDHRPRFELRYLREALRRDHTVTVHTYLADGKWRRWGGEGPDHLPLTPGELRDYDVVMIGDIGPETLGDSQMLAIENAVRRNGSGLVWLPGENGSTAGFAKHKLGSLLPAKLPDATSVGRGYLGGAPHRLTRTPAAANQGLLDSGGVPWNQLPDLLGASPVLGIEPAAEVLMEDQDRQPMVVARNYGVGGAGRAVLIATDDTWRWRRNVGDRYLHRFHSQLLRYAAAGRRANARPWRLIANPRRAVPGEVVSLHLAPQGAAEDQAPEHVTVSLSDAAGREVLVRLLPDGKGFTAHVPAPAAGGWKLGMVDGPSPGDVEDGELEVLPPTSEVRDPRADRAAAETLARSTGGRVFTAAKALVADLPDLRKTRMDTLPPTGLWDRAWAFYALLTLLSIEWALRRWSRLP